MACYACVNYEQLRRALELLGIVPKDGSGNDLSGYIKNLDAPISSVRDRLPSSLTANGNLPVALAEDSVGLARDSTVAAVRDRLPSSLTANGNLKVALLEDGVGLLKDSTFTESMVPSLVADNLASLDNSGGSTTAAMAVFSSDISVPDAGVLTIQVALDSEAKAKLRIVRGGNTLEYYLNAGNPLAANAWYEFSITVASGDSVNVLVEVPAGSTINAYAALLHRRR